MSGIRIYPVKSLDAQDASHVKILPSGALEHDRSFALFDAQGGFVNGKRHAAVHRLRSHMHVAERALTLRDGRDDTAAPHTFDVDQDRAHLEDWLSAFFGFSVAFREQTDCGFPDDMESPGPTIVSTATLREIGTWFALPVEQVRQRLRTNIEIDGVPPFWEDRLFGVAGELVRFRLGQVVLLGVNPCQRCVVPLRDPSTGAPDNTFVRRFTELRNRTLPAWSVRGRFDHFYRVAINTRLAEHRADHAIRVGDKVEILSPSAPGPAAVPDHETRPVDVWAGTLQVQDVIAETDTVKTFRLRPPDIEALPFRFLPGQFLAITFGAGQDAFQRCYSISSSPAQLGHCDITIKRDGIASSELHQNLVAGCQVTASGPMGRFVFDGRGSDEIVLIAGGVGITPLMSKLRFLYDTGWQGRIDLVYSVKTSAEIIFRDELQSLQHVWPCLRVHLTVTSEDAQWAGQRGRLRPAWLRTIVPDMAARHVHMCGPPALTTSVHHMLREIGVPESHIEIEAFGRPEPVRTASDDAQFEVRFARSDRRITMAARETLLDAALAAGLPVDHGCRAGACGRCRALLLEGEVDIDCDFILTPQEKALGMILTCQAHPSRAITIDM